MALLVMIFRKMIKNKWLELSMLLGLILSVALVTSMPIYTNAIVQRMLVKDLENLQHHTDQYPGVFWSSVILGDGEMDPNNSLSYIQNIDQFMIKEANPSFSLPIQTYVRERSTERYDFVPVHPDKVNPKVNRAARMGALSDLQDNITLVDGRLPADQPVDGVYEVLIVEPVLDQLKLVLGNELTIFSFNNAVTKIKVKPVGVFEKKDPSSLYWHAKDLAVYNSTFFIDFDLFEQDFTSSKVLPARVLTWYVALDYHELNMDRVSDYSNTYAKVDSYLAERFKNRTIGAYAYDTIIANEAKENGLRMMLWSLNVPVLMMIAFYLFMVSNLITERQKAEISVLRSRGASRWQIMSSFIIEGMILGALAFVIGPYIGLMLTQLLGSTNGFLEFVQRAALKAHINPESYVYALYAVIGSIIMTLIPAFLATGTSIVGHKQQLARRQKKHFWHKYYLDIALIGIAFYGLRGFQRRMEDMLAMGLDASEFSIDPLLFLVPALFILGMGLVCLRIYPWFIKLVYWIGRRWWPPSLYSTLIQVGRSSAQYQFLMVFLIVTIATGLFGASAARTMNSNAEDMIRYRNGADIVVNVRWENNDSTSSAEGGAAANSASSTSHKKKIQYKEPNFRQYSGLPGVDSEAKVFIKDDTSFSVGEKKGMATLMGIDTDDFGRTAWFRNGLLSYHFFDYLNLIAADPSAVLISQTLADAQKVKVGDFIDVGWDGVGPKRFTVYGIVDYFPTFQPNPIRVKGETPVTPMLVVGHLKTIQNDLALEPYEIWYKLKPNASRQEFYDSLWDRNLPLTGTTDTIAELVTVKNDPFQMAINGAMSLGFIISMAVSFFGFLLYWILSLYGRILQLGILRAMGISLSQLFGMLLIEQVLTSIAAVGIGVMTGNVTNRIFVPLFQLTFDPSTQVPPFKVITDPADSMHLYIIVTIMIALGLFILATLISRIKIHQAVKLGED